MTKPKYDPPVLCVGDGVLESSADVAKILGPLIGDLENEHFVCIALNRRNRVIEAGVMSIGSDSTTVVSPASILRWVLTRKRPAYGIIVAHNHPSGDPTVSREDIVVAERLGRACQVVGLTFLDSIVVAGKQYRSIMEHV